MIDAAVVLLGIAVASLSYVCINLTRRLRSLEDLLLAACDAVGGSKHERG